MQSTKICRQRLGVLQKVKEGFNSARLPARTTRSSFSLLCFAQLIFAQPSFRSSALPDTNTFIKCITVILVASFFFPTFHFPPKPTLVCYVKNHLVEALFRQHLPVIFPLQFPPLFLIYVLQHECGLSLSLSFTGGIIEQLGIYEGSVFRNLRALVTQIL